jgi:hypothetical protein
MNIRFSTKFRVMAAALMLAAVTLPAALSLGNSTVEAQNAPQPARPAIRLRPAIAAKTASAPAGKTGEAKEDPAAPVVAAKQWPSRETFSSLVVSGLPPALSGQFEEVAKRLSEVSGVALQPEWWRLDMAAFSTKAPFQGADVAKKLGLTVIADVGDDLVLAPEDTPKTRQAEARLYLLKLADASRVAGGVWKGPTAQDVASGFGSTQVRAMPAAAARVAILRAVAGGVVRPGNAGGAPVKAPETDKPAPETPADLFLLEGALTDQKVLNMLGLSAADIDKPLRNYDVQSFHVGPYKPEMEGGSRRTTYRYNPYTGRRQTEEGTTSIAIWAEAGSHQPNLPTGPALGAGGGFGNVLMSVLGSVAWQLQAMMRMRGNSWYTSYSNETSEAKKVEENAGYVCLLLDDLKPMRVADAAAVTVLRTRLEELRAKKASAEEILAGRLAVARAEDCLLGARTLNWADRSAVDLLRDPVDDQAPINRAKNQIAERARDMLTKYAKDKGAAAVWQTGSLGDYNLRNTYGFQYNWFQVQPYSDDWLMLSEDKDPAFKTHMLLKAGGTGDRSGVPEKYAFEVRIDRDSGAISWITGEPESMEMINGRRTEIFEGAKVLAAAVQNAAKTGTPIPEGTATGDWIKAEFKKAGTKELQYVSSLDFRVVRVVPGIVRVVGEAATPDSRQAVIVDMKTGQLRWETLSPDKMDKLPQNQPQEMWD